jgi:hypothetical protein
VFLILFATATLSRKTRTVRFLGLSADQSIPQKLEGGWVSDQCSQRKADDTGAYSLHDPAR